MPAGTGGIEAAIQDNTVHLRISGAWTIDSAEVLRQAIEALKPDSAGAVVVELSRLEALDTAGALLIRRLREQLGRGGRAVNLTGLRDEHATLIERVALAPDLAPLPVEEYRPLLAMVRRTGEAACAAYLELADLLYFLGIVATSAVRSVMHPTRIRIVPVLRNLERVGFDALPIVGLLSFLIGIVVAYQGADQLRRFGAEIFTVNLLGVSVFREMGILLAAIVIAGRSGSAFAAQIGTMQVNQEIDAMQTLGLDPVDMLVMPRLIALVVAMPLLAVYSDLMALVGGALMVVLTLDVSLLQFLERLQNAVTVSTFAVGIIKAPVFGLLIALTGCREGLKVRGSAESVGLHTTRAVVISIFLVIVADAVFSILFSMFGI